MQESQKKYTYTLLSALIVIAVFLVGVFVGYQNRPFSEKIGGVLNKYPTVETETMNAVDFEPFWKVWHLIDEKFPDASTVSTEQRLWGATKGLVAAFGDPYTDFLNPEEMNILEEDLTGEFTGVGMEVGIRDGILTVISPLRGTPAEVAGLEPGDRILEIDETATDTMSIDEAVKLIRGPKNTQVILTVAREKNTGANDIFDISITRDIINIPVLEKEFITDDIFYIALFNFDIHATQKFGQAIGEFLQSDSEKLILDLRNNPGGFLESSIEIASLFLPESKIITIEDSGKGNEKPYYSKGYNVIKNKENFEMVILINRGSASASEILAGALSEHGIATLVGEPSFGKGSVQELISVTKETSLKITIAKWLTPEHHSISEGGLTPDIIVEEPDNDNETETEKDVILDRAIQLLEK